MDISVKKDYVHINTNELKCPICVQVLVKPVVATSCGNMLCADCAAATKQCTMCKDITCRPSGKAPVLITNIIYSLLQQQQQPQDQEAQSQSQQQLNLQTPSAEKKYNTNTYSTNTNTTNAKISTTASTKELEEVCYYCKKLFPWKEFGAHYDRCKIVYETFMYLLVCDNGEIPVKVNLLIRFSQKDGLKFLAPIDSYASVSSSKVVSHEKRLYSIGGLFGYAGIIATVLRYDAPSNTWAEVSRLNVGRTNHQAVSLGGRIYVIGGVTSEGVRDTGCYKNVEISSVEVYDPLQNTWKFVASLNHPRGGHKCVAFGKYIYTFGGSHQERECGDIERYDPQYNKWEVIPTKTPFRKQGGYSVVADKNVIYIVSSYNGVVEAFDPIRNTCKEITTFGEFSGGVAAFEGKLFIASTNFANDCHELSLHQYDLSTNKWSKISTICYPHTNYSINLVAM